MPIMSDFNDTSQVKPIRFQALTEDGASAKDRKARSAGEEAAAAATNLHYTTTDETQMWASGRQQRKIQANFSFQYSYPAVIFDKVCFSVDRSQQQSNFMNECIYRLKNCAGLSEFGQQDKVNILKSINLNVPYGSIFGLLGPSSCGKTTLLRCLVGLLKPTSGAIRLFCQSSDTQNDSSKSYRCGIPFITRSTKTRGRSSSSSLSSKVPGSNVGYMPQDLGLYEDFSIRQLLTMFGQYMGMGSKLIESRIVFMAKFLDLPDVDREIMSLSGGQKRRVSFAIACIHMPPLIILDEPTVGVDPLLRQSIWKYLRRLADEENRTIIITTHYIEEAAQADQVALMRAGEILVQDTPARIMESNKCSSLEEAFLKICNNVSRNSAAADGPDQAHRYKLYPQPRFNWQDKLASEPAAIRENGDDDPMAAAIGAGVVGSTGQHGVVAEAGISESRRIEGDKDAVVRQLKLRAQEKLLLFDGLANGNSGGKANNGTQQFCQQHNVKLNETIVNNQLSMAPDILTEAISRQPQSVDLWRESVANSVNESAVAGQLSAHNGGGKERGGGGRRRKKRSLLRGRSKLVINSGDDVTTGPRGTITTSTSKLHCDDVGVEDDEFGDMGGGLGGGGGGGQRRSSFGRKFSKNLKLIYALLYKNYRRNLNSIPLLAFQFMLPIIQMISFSLCVGGRPTNIGLGLVNLDQPLQLSPGPSAVAADLLLLQPKDNLTLVAAASDDYFDSERPYETDELLSTRYLSFIDDSMISIKPYANLRDALNDVRQAKLWAAMEIGENFTTTILRRFDLENFYQLDLSTIQQSVIKLYPDRSNKVLDMICHRSLVNSYRKFLLDQFEHFKRLPIEVKEPIFDIKPNLISNSIDGYTESIAAGLLASLTYIMAAGLTTFIMVVERSQGILERTFTCGINPVTYLLAHAAFRSLVMMLQIGLVMFLTFYLLQQPLVGSIWLAYLMLMTLNLTGISYGLLISSIVTDQNGAALTIVSSLVVKITMSGILWPFEAIPRWLRTICYIQPLTMPIQALKSITLKGAGIDDKTVRLGFLVSITWLLLFLTISARRFKFYQH